MIIVKRIEDIQADMWCRATEENFTISSTEKMSTSLEKQGWKLATNEQIEGFKL